MMALAVLTAVIASTMENARVDTSLAGTFNRSTRASGVAETAIGVTARKVIDTYVSSGSINSLLDSIQFGTSGGGQYAVMILDNSDVGGRDQDGDGNEATDTDRAFRLVATGNLGTSEQVLEAYFKIRAPTPAPTPDAGGVGAVGLCANFASVDNADRIFGDDYTPPASPCSGAGCNGTDSGNPDKPGVSYNAGTTVDLDDTPNGNPPVNSDAGIDCGAWQLYLETAAAAAPTTLNASAGPFNASDYTTQFGSPTSPQVIVIQGPGSVTFSGNLYGNGILIIRNAQVEFTGTFTYAGLILIEDDGGGIKFKGTSNIFGSIMVLNANVNDLPVELDIVSNSSRINFSTEGLGRAGEAMENANTSSASLDTLAWRSMAN